MSLIKVRGIHKAFRAERTVLALKGISFLLEKGEHLFVLGETGSGKSTLLKCLAGVYDLDRGRIWFNGTPFVSPSQQLISGVDGIRLVEQDYGLHPYLNVEQTLIQAMGHEWTLKEKRSRKDFLLELFDLRKKGKKNPGELSGGQQQRLAMARSFARMPELLLLDEPFAHLDPQMKNRLFEYLESELDQGNIGAVTVTHDYKEALKNADRIMVLEKGKSVQVGGPQELYQNPQNLYVAGLLGEYNLIERGGEIMMFRPEGLSLTPASKGELRLQVIRQKYCGHYSEVYLANGEEEVVVIESGQRKYDRGQEVGVVTNRMDALLLDESTGELNPVRA